MRKSTKRLLLIPALLSSLSLFGCGSEDKPSEFEVKANNSISNTGDSINELKSLMLSSNEHLDSNHFNQKIKDTEYNISSMETLVIRGNDCYSCDDLKEIRDTLSRKFVQYDEEYLKIARSAYNKLFDLSIDDRNYDILLSYYRDKRTAYTYSNHQYYYSNKNPLAHSEKEKSNYKEKISSLNAINNYKWNILMASMESDAFGSTVNYSNALNHYITAYFLANDKEREKVGSTIKHILTTANRNDTASIWGFYDTRYPNQERNEESNSLSSKEIICAQEKVKSLSIKNAEEQKNYWTDVFANNTSIKSSSCKVEYKG